MWMYNANLAPILFASDILIGFSVIVWIENCNMGVGILCFDSVVYELWQLYGSVCKSLIGGEQKQRPTLNFSFGNRETEERGVGGLCGAAVAGPCYKPPRFCPL